MLKVYMERIDEPTPNGGSYSIAYYSDGEGNRKDKKEATHIEIVEFGTDDEQIMRTYGRTGK